jgi:hypothetical protein
LEHWQLPHANKRGTEQHQQVVKAAMGYSGLGALARVYGVMGGPLARNPTAGHGLPSSALQSDNLKKNIPPNHISKTAERDERGKKGQNAVHRVTSVVPSGSNGSSNAGCEGGYGHAEQTCSEPRQLLSCC